MLHRFATHCLTSYVFAATPVATPAPKPAAAIKAPAKPTKAAKKKTKKRTSRATPGLSGKPAKKKATRKKAKRKVSKGPAARMVDKVQKFYEKTDDLSADFIQIYTRSALSKTYESRGTVKLKKPGMMRWDYRLPAKKHFIADGKKLFIYEPEEEQVIIDKNFQASQLSSSVSFLWGQGEMAKSFVAKLGSDKVPAASPGRTVLELTPRSDATYRLLVLIVDTATGRVEESVLYETSGNTNHFKFRSIKSNTGVSAKVFTFTPPPDVDIIERP